HASYERCHVLRAVAHAASQGATLDEITARADAYLAGPQAIALGPGRWTTPEIIALERRVLDLAAQPARRDLAADSDATAAAIGERPSLTGEQRRMVTTLCRSGRPVDVVVG